MPDLYSATEAARERFERRLIPQTRRRLEEAADTFAKAAAGARRPEGAILRAQMAADKPELAIDVLEMIYRPVTVAFANAARSGVAAMKQNHDDDWLQRVRRFLLTEGAEMVRAITDTTREDVRRILTEGAEEGLGVEAMARRLEAEWEDLARNRSRNIVRTEITGAANQATLWGAEVAEQETGIRTKKEWLSTPGGRTRETHAAANHQVVGMNETFNIGGFPARYPGDPQLPIRERAQCRCALAIVPAEDATRSYIDKRNEKIRAAYPELKKRHNRPIALEKLQDQFHLSPSYIKDILYR